ncbi:MAG: hypothetical protein DRR16_08415 [Candidatus Parabeggiatoa sp. nov. 3]|nr:MAG: hypothetical protein DRR00_26190 [Gammaproteobacteria bacterium]RKZ50964.1 MAG: hypothetical protein DRQ99_33465 [Gammaproteobacteria bacterium]RKZ86948.1 MAG: hypothetical protein DRR16_08415 [Gammaproteobacteria bacterium]
MRKNVKAFLLILLSVYFANVLGIETDLTVKLDKSEVKPGEIVTLDLVARNPLDKTVQGSIIVSFSSEVEIVEKDEESIEYGIGSKVYCVGHIHCLEPTKEMMVENWYNQWFAGEEKTMNLTLKATETGTLKIYARAAFIENLKKKHVINIPREITDQQGYPAHVRYVSVKNQNFWIKSKISDAEIDDFIKKNKFEPNNKIGKSVEFRAMTGMMAYKYADPFNQEEFSDNIPFIGAGFTGNLINLPILNNISLDLYGQWSDKARDGFFSRTVDEGLEELENVNSAFNRDDFAITVGWQPPFLHKNVSVFAGYKWSKTDAHLITIKDIEDSKMMDVTRSESHFKTAGWFVGPAYTCPLDKKNQHKLGFYLAYGGLKGKYDFTAFVGEQSFPNEQTINSTTAWRGGVSLNGLLTRLNYGKLTYGISLDGYYYTMDMGITESDLGSVVPRTFVEEQVYSLKASLNWVYDF